MKRSNVVVEVTGNEVTKFESGLATEVSANVVYRNEDASIKDVKYIEASGNDYEPVLKRDTEREKVDSCGDCDKTFDDIECTGCDKYAVVAEEFDDSIGFGTSSRSYEMRKYIIEQRKGGIENGNA